MADQKMPNQNYTAAVQAFYRVSDFPGEWMRSDGKIEDGIVAAVDATVPLARVQRVNDERKQRWHAGAEREWSVLEWAGAMCGEAGEAANVAKKLLRIELGTRGNEVAEHAITERDELTAKLASEIGGVVLYCALLASNAGIDFERAIVETFNEKSEALGFPERL